MSYKLKMRDGFKEHRLIMKPILLDALEELFPDEKWVVHHKDENPQNNDILNLEVMTHGEHNKLHHGGKINSSKTIKRMRNRTKARPYAYLVIRKGQNPWTRVWNCRIRTGNKRRQSLGYFEDPISCEIVAKIVLEEI